MIFVYIVCLICFLCMHNLYCPSHPNENLKGKLLNPDSCAIFNTVQWRGKASSTRWRERSVTQRWSLWSSVDKMEYSVEVWMCFQFPVATQWWHNSRSAVFIVTFRCKLCAVCCFDPDKILENLVIRISSQTIKKEINAFPGKHAAFDWTWISVCNTFEAHYYLCAKYIKTIFYCTIFYCYTTDIS